MIMYSFKITMYYFSFQYMKQYYDVRYYDFMKSLFMN